MGEVYRATDTALERTVAVKLLADHYARQDDARARFRREAMAAARLSGAPNVVTVFDVAEHGGRPLIVMEYLEGGSVHERLREGRVPRAVALDWLEQTATALDRAHASGVVHRDVKPANLLLDRDGNVHVADFGIASVSGSDMLTAPGTVLGTAGYLAPEQARGEPATPASDRYALGVVAFELLTGRRPFAGDTPTTEAFAHLNAPIPRAVEIDPDLPRTLDLVFESALAKDPAARPATANELVARLREALDHASDSARTEILAARPAPRRIVRRDHRPEPFRRTLAALVALALLGTGLAAAVLIAPGDGSAPAQIGSGREARQPGGSTASALSSREAVRSSSGGTTTTEPSRAAAASAREGFARMQAGDYAAALPLLRRAVLALRWSNTLDEAYASYNLAFSRFAVGRCDGVVGLLDRSERIQGRRAEIDDLRRQWQARCAPADRPSDERGNDRGRGKAKGHDEESRASGR